MRLLYWVDRFWPYIGGVEVSAAEMVPALREDGDEILVLTGSQGELPARDELHGVPVERLPLTPALISKDPARIGEVSRRAQRAFESFRPDLIHAVFTFAPSVFFLRVALRAFPAPVLLRVPGFVDVETGRDSVLRNSIDLADWVTTPSDAVRRHLLALYPHLDGRVETIHTGLAPPPAAGPSPRTAEEERAGPVVLCCGRLSSEKGFDVALRGFAAARSSHPAATLLVAGDGDEREVLEALAAELGIGEVTEFGGWWSPERRWELYESADVVLVPSRCLEGFGRVAAEAALAGRPVVASRMGGLTEVIADGETGLMFENEDAEGLARQLVALLDDPGRAAAMGAAARTRALSMFGLEPYLDRYRDRHRRLAQARSGTRGAA